MDLEGVGLHFDGPEIRVDEGEPGESVCGHVVQDVSAVLVDLGVLDGLQAELVVEVLRLPRVGLQRETARGALTTGKEGWLD